MSERSAHTRWYSDELDAELDEWASNSKATKADLIELALRDLFDRYHIDEDGHVSLPNRGPSQGVFGTQKLLNQVLDNQDDILAAIEGSRLEGSRTTQKINSEAISTERDERGEADSVQDEDGECINELELLPEKLIGEWDHNEMIDPDGVDLERLKQTPDHRAPVMTGIVNYLREEEGVRKMERSKLVEELAHAVGYSKTGVRDNYLSRLERQGAVYPHPSIDDNIDVSESIPEGVPMDDKEFLTWEELSDEKKQKRYPDSLDEYIDMIGVGWRDESYYLSEEAWIDGVRELLYEGWQEMHKRRSTVRETQVRVTKMEAANAYRLALCRVWEAYREAADLSDVDVENVDDGAVEDAIYNFAAATNVVMRGKDEMEDYRKVVGAILRE